MANTSNNLVDHRRGFRKREKKNIYIYIYIYKREKEREREREKRIQHYSKYNNILCPMILLTTHNIINCSGNRGQTITIIEGKKGDPHLTTDNY